MSLPVPISVRLINNRGDRRLTRQLQNVSYDAGAPGGFKSAQMVLSRPLHYRPDELTSYTKCVIEETRSGAVLWDGHLDEPGRSAGASGQIWELTAVGPAAHAHDRTLPHIFVDKLPDDWPVASASVKYIEVSETDSNGESAVIMRCPEGTTWTQNDYGEVWYRRLLDTGQRLARVFIDWDTATTSTNTTIEVGVSVGASDFSVILDWDLWHIDAGTLTGVITTDWSAGTQYDVIYVLALRGGPNVVVGNNAAQWFLPVIRTVLYDKSGNERTAASNYSGNTVRAYEVIEDLLGRILTEYDGAGALVETDTFNVDQWAYREAVDPAQIFADAMVFHPGKTWLAWERNASGKYAFEWRSWPTSTIRYEVPVIDGFDSPGSTVDLVNYMNVRYIGGQGRPRHRRRTQTVELLDTAGVTGGQRIREHYLDLGETAGSEANAIRAGDEHLAEHAFPASGATLTIARPVLDRATGRVLMPWELPRHMPGHLVKTLGVQSNRDVLNATGRDGETVYRITDVSFNAESAVAICQLDGAPATLTHLAATGRAPRAAAVQSIGRRAA
jgi:hypothetical protein